ncbi:serine/threonine-protein kinase [bacterium]|nr:serine/threonine-protein kinase [bacterium]
MNDINLNLNQLGNIADNLDNNARIIIKNDQPVEGKIFKSRLSRLLHKSSQTNQQIWNSLKTSLSNKYDSSIASKVMGRNIDSSKPLTARQVKVILRNADDLQLQKELVSVTKQKGIIFDLEQKPKYENKLNELKQSKEQNLLDLETLRQKESLSDLDFKKMDEILNQSNINSKEITKLEKLIKDLEQLDQENPGILDKKEALDSKQFEILLKLTLIDIRGSVKQQCEKFTELLNGDIPDEFRTEYENKFISILSKIQMSAKTSEEDFKAYNSLLDSALTSGLMSEDSLVRMINSKNLSTSETLSILKAFTMLCKSAEVLGESLLKEVVTLVKSNLVNSLSELTNLEPALSDYKNAPEIEKDIKAGKLISKFLDYGSKKIQTELKNYSPTTEQETNLKETLLQKYREVGASKITERDYQKIGQLLGNKDTLCNLAILSKYVQKEGQIKTTEYVDAEIKNRVKETIGDKIKTLEDVKNVSENLKNTSIDTVEELDYLKNKLKKKIRDYLPVAGNDVEVNRMNKSIIKGLEKNIFITPEQLKFEMLTIERSIGSGGGNAIIFAAGTKENVLNKLSEWEEEHIEDKGKYQVLTQQLNELTKNVNESQHFAFKCFKVSDESTQANMEKEVSISKKLNHPNIINSYFSIDSANRKGVVMDLCAKGDFHHVLMVDSDLPIQDREYNPETSKGVKNIAKIILGAVEGLHFMHQSNMVHRDMKLENIFISDDNQAKVGDFGLVKEIESEIEGLSPEEVEKLKDPDTSTMRIGTSVYMPPEVMSTHSASLKMDTYSMGMTALLSMFEGNTNKLVEGGKVFNLELKMAQPGLAKGNIETWLNDEVFGATEEGQIMKNFIENSMKFNPENRISYTESINLLQEIINS